MDRLTLADALEKAINDPNTTADMFGEYARWNLLTILSALRASDTGRSEAEASKPAEGVRPPGETLWLAHGAMFGSEIADWDSLGLADKLRWASVEDAAMRNLLAQSNDAALHPPAGQGEATDG